MVLAARNARAECEITAMNPPNIRTADPDTRAQQWARVTELTYECLTTQDAIQDLRLCIHALKQSQAWEWRLGNIDVELNQLLLKRITSRVEALKVDTDTLSSLQSELISLQTALDDNYERNE